MAEPGPWFVKAEYLARLDRIQSELQQNSLDALIAFQPETVTWTTGFFTRGYGSFQFAIVPANGLPAIVCRDVEEFYVDTTSVFPDRQLWSDSDDHLEIGAHAIRERLGSTPALAVELSAWPLSAGRFAALKSALPGAVWHDHSQLVSSLRLIKSPAELDYQRRAGKAAEAGMTAAVSTAAPGVSEREIAAEITAAMIRAGSDVPGPGVLSSGIRAHHLHGGYSDRVLQPGDIVQIETTPGVRHYHARFMRPLRVGAPTDRELRTVERLIAIQDAALAEVGPNVSASVPDAVYRDGVLSAGLRNTYANKTFYSVGLILHPSGGEQLEAVQDCDWNFEAGMTFHTYVLAQAIGMSETIAITGDGYERLTNYPRQMFVC